MLDEVGLDAEASAAPPAPELLSLVVGLHVCSQIASVSKSFAALGTPKGLLASVGPHVSLQQPGSRESFAADITFV